MRRSAPRPAAPALAAVARRAAPATPLARAQAAWRDVVGEVMARESEPVAERGGVLTVACRSGAWANELELMAGEFAERLQAALGGPATGRAGMRLRFVVRSTVDKL